VLSAYPGLLLSDVRSSAEHDLVADVVVWDAPEADARIAGSPVLALVAAAPEARQALRSGAHGALSRAASAPSIAAAALAVAAGNWVLDATFAGALVELEGPLPQASSPISPREQEVLELMAEGLSNRDIAARLGISRHTAKFHVNAILDSLADEALLHAAWNLDGSVEFHCPATDVRFLWRSGKFIPL